MPVLMNEAVATAEVASTPLASLDGFANAPQPAKPPMQVAVDPQESAPPKRGLTAVLQSAVAVILVSLGTLASLVHRRRADGEPLRLRGLQDDER